MAKKDRDPKDVELLTERGWDPDDVDKLSDPAFDAVATTLKMTPPPPPEPPPPAVTEAMWASAEQDFREWNAGLRTDAEVAARNAEVLRAGDPDELCDRLGLSHGTLEDIAALA